MFAFEASEQRKEVIKQMYGQEFTEYYTKKYNEKRPPLVSTCVVNMVKNFTYV